MVSCANIVLEKIRAEIDFGGGLIFTTPDIKSFSVSRARQQFAATFSASIEVPASTVFPAGADVVIRAGTLDNLKTIFTGKVLNITVNPSFEKAITYLINLSGSDRFQELEGKTFSRRQRTRGPSMFAAITGVTDRPSQKGISYEKRIQSGGRHRIANKDTNLREHSKLVQTDRAAWDPFGMAKDPESTLAESAEAATDVIDIKPRSVSLAPGVSARFQVENTSFEEGDSWSVSDSGIGTIITNADGTATYTQLAIGENTINFTKGNGGSVFVGKATAVGIPIHTHESLGQGGPAFGVYSSE